MADIIDDAQAHEAQFLAQATMYLLHKAVLCQFDADYKLLR